MCLFLWLLCFCLDCCVLDYAAVCVFVCALFVWLVFPVAALTFFDLLCTRFNCFADVFVMICVFIVCLCFVVLWFVLLFGLLRA